MLCRIMFVLICPKNLKVINFLKVKVTMDELTAALAGSFQVTHHPNNPAAPHPRFQDLYKTKRSILDQHERRRRAIQHQKKFVI